MSALLLLSLIAAVAGLLLGWRATLPAARTGLPDAERAAAQRQLAALADADSLMPAPARADEALRLRAELRDAAAAPDVAEGSGVELRLGWRSAALLAVLVPLLAVPLYAWRQAPYWRAVAQAPAIPPEARAMVARLESRLATTPDDVEGWKRLGRSYGVMGRTGDAQRAYARAAALAPDDLMVLDGYGDLGAAAPHPPAIAALLAKAERAVRELPQEPRAWARLAFTRSRLGDGPGARDAYAKAHGLDPQRVELLAAYAAAEYALAPQEPSAQAQALYRQLLAVMPDNPAALWVVGVSDMQAGDAGAASGRWEKLLGVLDAQDPMRAMVLQALGAARARQAESPGVDD